MLVLAIRSVPIATLIQLARVTDGMTQTRRP